MTGDKKITGKKIHRRDYARHSRPLWPLDDEELARRAQKGSDDAFTELVLRYGGRLYSFLAQKSQPALEVEDLLQETFLKAYLNIHRYQPRAKFSAWIFTIAARLAIDRFRSHSRWKNLEEIEVVAEEPIDHLEQQEQKQNLWRLARQLPQNQYRALWLKYAENMNIPEIARVMRKSRANIKIILYRARINLASRMKQRPDQDMPPDPQNK
ncbi:RNA polymerase sigma factor [Planctomycetota bacterium]